MGHRGRGLLKHSILCISIGPFHKKHHFHFLPNHSISHVVARLNHLIFIVLTMNGPHFSFFVASGITAYIIQLFFSLGIAIFFVGCCLCIDAVHLGDLSLGRTCFGRSNFHWSRLLLSILGTIILSIVILYLICIVVRRLFFSFFA